ncbi:DUF6461 domain-containing protein [Embleya sp. NPDC056575]|uniref:DUF6461 domain-containing protein n=1 Tax=unclassified Embleya TaxID=2699296 RepID=UPI00368DD3B1
MTGDGFRWLAEHTHFPIGFCATFARGLSAQELLERLGCVPEYTAVRDAMDADDLRDDLMAGEDEEIIIAIVRAGSRGDWAFGFEAVTLYAADGDKLGPASAGTDVVSLRRDAAHGETWFELWRDGQLVEHRTAWDPDDLADLEAELGIDAPLLDILSPTAELLTGFARWDA